MHQRFFVLRPDRICKLTEENRKLSKKFFLGLFQAKSDTTSKTRMSMKSGLNSPSSLVQIFLQFASSAFF
jgi:hypothetical protein